MWFVWVCVLSSVLGSAGSWGNVSYRHRSSGRRNARWTATSSSSLSSASLRPSNLSVHTLFLYQLSLSRRRTAWDHRLSTCPSCRGGETGPDHHGERWRDGGRQGKILGRWRDLISRCRREEEGRDEEDDTCALNHWHIPHRPGAFSLDRNLYSPLSPLLSPSLHLSLPFLQLGLSSWRKEKKIINNQQLSSHLIHTPQHTDVNTHMCSEKTQRHTGAENGGPDRAERSLLLPVLVET